LTLIAAHCTSVEHPPQAPVPRQIGVAPVQTEGFVEQLAHVPPTPQTGVVPLQFAFVRHCTQRWEVVLHVVFGAVVQSELVLQATHV
jgi:hypothetical protein